MLGVGVGVGVGAEEGVCMVFSYIKPREGGGAQ